MLTVPTHRVKTYLIGCGTLLLTIGVLVLVVQLVVVPMLATTLGVNEDAILECRLFAFLVTMFMLAMSVAASAAAMRRFAARYRRR
jgi:hypothetical protein